jgi:hypothetical protein
MGDEEAADEAKMEAKRNQMMVRADTHTHAPSRPPLLPLHE